MLKHVRPQRGYRQPHLIGCTPSRLSAAVSLQTLSYASATPLSSPSTSATPGFDRFSETCISPSVKAVVVSDRTQHERFELSRRVLGRQQQRCRDTTHERTHRNDIFSTRCRFVTHEGLSASRARDVVGAPHQCAAFRENQNNPFSCNPKE